jgi:hypothetical protein
VALAGLVHAGVFPLAAQPYLQSVKDIYAFAAKYIVNEED